MNKSELVAAVAGHTGTDPKLVATVLNGTEDVIVATVKKGAEKVAWTGFVGFEQVARKARRGRNPATGEAIRVKAKKAPRVSAGAGFKKVVAGDSPAPKLTVAKPAKAVSTKTAAAVKKARPAKTTRTATKAAPRKTVAAASKPAPAGAKRAAKR
jgi:DNA-binding protein HU-beta